MEIIYNKLVRDKIPEIIKQSGNNCEISCFSAGEYNQALKLKLIEESQEIVKAKPEDLITELADLYEVIDCLLEAESIPEETVIEEQIKRKQERGSFQSRIKLISTTIEE